MRKDFIYFYFILGKHCSVIRRKLKEFLVLMSNNDENVFKNIFKLREAFFC